MSTIQLRANAPFASNFDGKSLGKCYEAFGHCQMYPIVVNGDKQIVMSFEDKAKNEKYTVIVSKRLSDAFKQGLVTTGELLTLQVYDQEYKTFEGLDDQGKKIYKGTGNFYYSLSMPSREAQDLASFGITELTSDRKQAIMTKVNLEDSAAM